MYEVYGSAFKAMSQHAPNLEDLQVPSKHTSLGFQARMGWRHIIARWNNQIGRSDGSPSESAGRYIIHQLGLLHMYYALYLTSAASH